MKLKKNILLLVGLALLLSGVFIVWYSSVKRNRIALHSNLLSVLPRVVAGWEIKDMPIASSAEMQKAVNEMLNYDEAVFREYRKGTRSLTVYSAYWSPYRFHPRLISIHTPDVCWVGNGFLLKDADYNYTVKLPQGGDVWHAQQRVFEAGGQDMHVLYWHVLGGRLSGYAEGPNSASRSIFDTFWSDLRHGAGEQFFIRISSQQPWSEWVGDPLFNQILKTFEPVLKVKP